VLEQELQTVRVAVDEFNKYHAQTEERAYAKALKELQEQKKQAISESNGEVVVEIDNAIDELKENKPAPAKKLPENDKKYQKLFEAWEADNQWVHDKALQAAANGFADVVTAENVASPLLGREFLDEVTKKVKEAFPERFTSPKERASAVEGATSTPRSNSAKRGYADLPADAKAACDKYVKEKLLTREQYVNDYDWE
jgi:organic radical activating enzyme